MRPCLPRITGTELVRALERDGWYKSRQAGSHAVFRHPVKPGRAVIPIHAGAILPPGIVSRVLKDTGLTPESMRELLK